MPRNPSRKSRLGRRYSDYRRPEPVAPPSDPAEGVPAASAGAEDGSSHEAGEATDGLADSTEHPPEPAWTEPEWNEASASAGESVPDDSHATAQSISELSSSPPRRRRRPALDGNQRWRWLAGIPVRGILIGCAAGALGFLLGRNAQPDRSPSNSGPANPSLDARRAAPVPRMEPAAAARIEEAFAALKSSRFADARSAFAAVGDLTPSLRTARSWTEFFAGNFSLAESQVLGQIQEGVDPADAYFLLGLLRAARSDYPGAGQAFSAAAALDPTRAEIEFLWGDTLRREGRPREAIAHFRAALQRNRQETNEGFYQYKLWLSQLEAGGEDAAEAENKLPGRADSSASASGFVQLSLAAQALQRGHVSGMVERLSAARRTLEPSLFRIGLQDPIWASEKERPELLEFFR